MTSTRERSRVCPLGTSPKKDSRVWWSGRRERGQAPRLGPLPSCRSQKDLEQEASLGLPLDYAATVSRSFNNALYRRSVDTGTP
jgi:hypothetical protein